MTKVIGGRELGRAILGEVRRRAAESAKKPRPPPREMARYKASRLDKSLIAKAAKSSCQ
jgi:hypothetical protein